MVRSSLAFFRGGSLRRVRAAAAMIEELMGEARNVTLVQRLLVTSNATTVAALARS